MFEQIEKLRQDYTDKYVVVDATRPELARFSGFTGQVKTVNMSGRALVEFDAWANIGWYDIDPSFLRVVPKPEPKPEAEKKHDAPAKKAAPAAKAPAEKAAPAAKPAAKSSTADILAAARAKAAGGAASAPAPAAGARSRAQPTSWPPPEPRLLQLQWPRQLHQPLPLRSRPPSRPPSPARS